LIRGRFRPGTTTGSDDPAAPRIGALRVSLLIMGLSGIVAQIMLLRELLVSFLGNELVLGIILANWLILEAAGAFLVGKTAEAAKRKQELYLLFQLLFSLTLPLAIYFSRVFKTMILPSPGEAVGFASIFAVSFLILLPVAVTHGALFTFGSKLYCLRVRHTGASQASSIGWVYVLETFGSILGGLMLTFILIQRFHSFTIACAVSMINALISVALLWPKPTQRPGPLNRSLWGASILLTVSYSLLLFSPLADRIHLSSIRTQWRGLELVHTENSIYGNITVTGRDGQRTFFTDGVPAVTTPVPDIASIEDFVHFPMLLHPQPESVLILSGGAGGMIHEVLKHPVKQIDYVELDPLLLRLIGEYGSGLTRQELSDERVEIHYTDGRFFLTRIDKRYDIVFIGLGCPQELQTNRLFSREFFSTAKGKMNPQGMIALSLPGSLTYLSEELRKLNACVLETLKSVFPHVRIIPGDVNLYFASGSPNLMRVSAADMARRLEERRIPTNLLTGPYIEYRLQEQWLNGYEQALGQLPLRINSDFRPLAVFYSLSYWNALFSPYLAGIFNWIEGARLSTIAVLIAAASLVVFAVFLLRPTNLRAPLPYAIATTGFCGMVFDLAIIFTFQTLFGYLYYQIGLLVTVFMAGAALSSLLATRRLDRIAGGTPAFLISELCLVCFSLVLPFAFMIPSRSLDKPSVYLLLYALFLSMSFVSGVLTGVQFPLAVSLHLGGTSETKSMRRRIAGEPAHTAGLLYGADLLGGYFGGLIGGVILLPILGLKNTCFILGMIKGSSLFLNLLYAGKRRYLC
jgi:spermidine synthase